MDKYYVIVKCPYCGREQNMGIERSPGTYKEVCTCDSEEGGCGRDYVGVASMIPTTRSVKIEGEQERYGANSRR